MSVGAAVDELECDVAIIGLGPVGALLADLLVHEGVRVVALDREPDVMDLPRGVGIDGEIMRAMQTIGLAETLEPFLKVFRGAQYLDADGGIVSTRPPAPLDGEQGWADRYNVHQPEFERVLRDRLRASGLAVELTRHEVTGVENVDGGVRVTATDLATGVRRTVRAAYAVGCDGGRSTTRRAIGATLDDYGLNQPWIVADFTVTPDADVPEINTHFADPVSPAIYIHVVRDIRRFEFRARPDEDLGAAVEESAIWQRVSRWISPADATLLRAAVYTHRSLVASRWREGAVLLAGDAAHQTPPFLGQGLCTGVRDAVSLAWRLRDVVRRGASPELLDSYGAERAAHARSFITTATELGSHLTKPSKEAIDSLNARVGREGRGRAPRLGDGLHDPEAGGGRRAPQPRLSDGTRLDDATGYEFALVHTDAFTAADVRSVRDAGIRAVRVDGAAAEWLDREQAVAALIRPDRYLYGVYADPDDALSAARTVAAVLAPTPVGSGR